jgi:hypothetical protein
MAAMERLGAALRCGVAGGKGDPMTQLMFRCPYTNKPIASGMDFHGPSLLEMSDYPISVMCPHCGFQHHGTVSDGCLADALPETPEDARPQPRDIASRMKKR